MARGDFASTPLTQSEAKRILRRARSRRDRAMIVLLWRAGLRCAEACGLDCNDVTELDSGAMRLHVRAQKGRRRTGRMRHVGLDKRAADYLRPLLGGIGPLLRTRTGQPLQTSQVRRSVALLASGAGIKRRVHPHALRHTFARELHDEGFTMREIQVALGHASLATTQVYLESIGCASVVDDTTRREW